MADPVNQDALLDQFVAVTGATEEQAQEYLTATSWNVDSAVASFFEDQDEQEADVGAPVASDPEYTGPRTLDGRPAPQSTLPSTTKPQKKKGLATLGSIGGSSGGHGHHGHDHDDEDDDDYDDEEDERKGPRDLFAGGEKSGLAVQDPAQRQGGHKKLINDILAKAKQNAEEIAHEPPQARPSRFGGSGQTLGGDGVPSRTIPDPRAPPAGAQSSRTPLPRVEQPREERVLHLWLDGFSIDDGELHRYDDPANARDLQMIQQGQAPLHLMNVDYDQDVDVSLQQHRENYHPLPKTYKPFGGAGRRLGSPVPGETSIAAPPPAPPNARVTTPAAAASSSSSGPATDVDDSQPTVTLRIQMPNGTRLPARFNTTQTVGDVYGFVERADASTAAGGRTWVLATTFPNKEHTDRSLALGDVPEFKKGGTAVVKWK